MPLGRLKSRIDASNDKARQRMKQLLYDLDSAGYSVLALPGAERKPTERKTQSERRLVLKDPKADRAETFCAENRALRLFQIKAISETTDKVAGNLRFQEVRFSKEMITKIFWTGLLLVLPFSVAALGLGGISVDSFLDEPLNARIELVSPDLMEVDDIQVSLAGPDVFQKAGLERPVLLSQLTFTPQIDQDGRVHIQVASRQAVREPYLNFLVHVRWPGGGLLKEYTVLLDPPSYRPPAMRAAAAAATSRSGTVEQAAQRGRRATYGPVRRSETLWVIARNTRPDGSFSVEQMMMALQRRNPAAFRQGNVNLLKQGVILEIPDRALIAELSAREARARFQQQNREWRAMRNRAPGEPGSASAARQEPKSAAEIQHRRGSSTRPEPAPVLREVHSGKADSGQPIKRGEERLRVVEPPRQWSIADPAASAYSYPSDDVEKLREAIADTKQDLLAVREINRDLEALQNVLEAQIQVLRESLVIKDKEISRLTQRGPATETQPVGSAEGRGNEPTRNADPQGVLRRGGARVPEAAGLELITPLAEPDSPATPPQPVFRWVQAKWTILLVVVALLSLLLMIRIRRREPTAARNQEVNSFRSYTELDQGLPGEVTSDQTAASFRSYADDQGLFPEAGEDVASILTKADIYLAYRQYNQAVSLVRASITDHPGDRMLQAKLLEIYAFRQDKQGFIDCLEEVHEAMVCEEPDLWSKVVAMGRDLVPDHPLIRVKGLPGEQRPDAGVDELLALEDALASSVVTRDEALPDDIPLPEMEAGLYQRSNPS